MALVGIARLASQSELVEAKRGVQYFEMAARSILNRTSPRMPFQWTINPYRGCELGCKYCFARYTHEFMEMDASDFEDKIYAKSAAAQLLRRELGRVERKEHIAMGTATDPYQPAERRFGRTRSILEVFVRERGRRLGITTKSDLIVRDLELLREIARGNVLHVNFTITTLDEKLARLLEPRAPRPALRLAALRKLGEAGIAMGVFANPVMPGLTDGERQLDRLGEDGARRGSAVVRRRAAVLDAVGTEGVSAASGAGVPRVGSALSGVVCAQCVLGRRVQGASARGFARGTGWKRGPSGTGRNCGRGRSRGSYFRYSEG